MLSAAIHVYYVPRPDIFVTPLGFILGGQLWVSVFRREAQE